MIKTAAFYLSATLLVWINFSCVPEGAEYVDELDLVYTDHNPEFAFNSQNTFSLPNQVIKVTGELVDGDEDFQPEFVDPIYASVILNGIRNNLENLGYTEVDKNADPDLIVLVSTIQTDELYFYYDWWYWNWWYPGWGPGWGWYYPGYFPPQFSRVRTGTVLIQMTHPTGISASDKIPVIWTGIINGLLEGSQNQISNRISKGIDQAFSQSPYLAK